MAEAISRAGGLALIASAGGRLEPDLEAAGGELIKLPGQFQKSDHALANAWQLVRDRRRAQRADHPRALARAGMERAARGANLQACRS